jgi:hypothetical protein
VIVLAIDWVAAGTIALAVVGTLGVVVNVVLVRATDKLAREATKQGLAADREAQGTLDMVTEVRKDRELGVRPVLVFLHKPETHGDPPKQVPVAVANIGTGPAITCWFAAVYLAPLTSRGETVFLRTAYFLPMQPLRVGAEASLGAPQSTHDLIDVALKGLKEEAGWTELVLCADILGHKHRFFRRSNGADEWDSDILKQAPPTWTEGW